MKRPFFLLLLIAEVLTISGCGPQTDCKVLSKKLDRCATEIYLSVSDGPAPFVESLTTERGGLASEARTQVARLWKEEKTRLAHKFVSKLARRCERDKGRYRESKDLNRCLNIADCNKFAQCFGQAAKHK